MMDSLLPDSDKNALRWEKGGGGGAMIVMRIIVSPVDEPLWEHQGEIHCERIIGYLSTIHQALPKFLKYI